MSTLHHRFLEPLDVLFLRGNKLFGDAGSYGEALIPPWPSVAAGALRSRLMADDPTLTAAALQDPENFTLAAFHLARRVNGNIQTLHPLPSDLVVTDTEGKPGSIAAINPKAIAAGLLSSATLQMLPVLTQAERGKPVGGYWLDAEGWGRYLQGQLPAATHLVNSKDLWSLETRVGVGLDAATRRADDGKLFTVQAIVFNDKVGFMVAAKAQNLPGSGMLRFGGDGRAVTVSKMPAPPNLFPAVAVGQKFKLVLTAPGIFEGGWRLPGLQADNTWQGPDGCSARLVCAAIGRAETISGWDLAQWQPKPAQRVAPTGSVYWFEDFQGDPGALGKLADTGFWGLPGQKDDAQRKAEGFNNIAVGSWT